MAVGSAQLSSGIIADDEAPGTNLLRSLALFFLVSLLQHAASECALNMLSPLCILSTCSGL